MHMHYSYCAHLVSVVVQLGTAHADVPFMWVKGKEVTPLMETKETHMKKLHVENPSFTAPPTVRTAEQLQGIGPYIAPILYGGKLHASGTAGMHMHSQHNPTPPPHQYIYIYIYTPVHFNIII